MLNFERHIKERTEMKRHKNGEKLKTYFNILTNDIRQEKNLVNEKQIFWEKCSVA